MQNFFFFFFLKLPEFPEMMNPVLLIVGQNDESANDSFQIEMHFACAHAQ